MKNAPKTIEDYFAAPDIHEAQRETLRGGWAFLLGAMLCPVEYLLWYAVAIGRLPMAVGLSLHAALVVLLALYAWALLKRGQGNPFILLLLLTVATTGPFGAAGVMLTVMTYAWFTRRAHSFEEWFESLFPQTAQSMSQNIYADMRMGRDESDKSYNIIPFLDVLSFGADEQKHHALAKMTSHFHPHFAPAFKKALADPSNMIRVQAATAISRIETLFLERMIKLSALMERLGDDPVVVLATAQHYDNYAYTGLLDADREQTNRQKALEYYHTYLRLRPQDLDVRSRIGRLLMRNSDHGKACDWLRQCINQGYISGTISQWYSEVLFTSGRYDELRRYRASLTPADGQDILQPALREALALWSGSAA